jgi:hypothetical protein
MPSQHLSAILLAGLFFAALGGAVRGASGGGPPPDMSIPPSILPALKESALARGIRLDGFDSYGSDSRLRVGDSVTALFTVFERSRYRQWIAEMKIAALTEEERDGNGDGSVVYSQTGRQMHYASGIAAMSLRILGPVADEPGTAKERGAFQDVRTRAAAHDAFLRLGAEGLCRVGLEIAARGREPQLLFSSEPFSPREIAEGKRKARAAGFTPEDEIAFGNGFEALEEFTTDAENIPGIVGIVSPAVDWPSIWTMLREMNFSVWSVFDWKTARSFTLEIAGKPASAYHLPFRIYMFGSNVSQGGWTIMAPRSPLVACGGIVGVWLQSIKHPENRMVMRLIAAHRGD